MIIDKIFTTQLTEVAGEGGFEPPITGPKPVALPLGYSPEELINFILDF